MNTQGGFAHRFWRRFGILAAVVALVVSSVSPVAGSHYVGYFSTGIIDTDSDGKWDIQVCYGTGPGNAIYDNRGSLSPAMRIWDTAAFGDDGLQGGAQYVDGLASGGACDSNDPSQVFIQFADLGPCSYFGGVAGRTLNPVPGWNGMAKVTIHLNSNCGALWDWTEPTANDKISAPTVVAHEFGHALGLAHSGTNTLMSDGGPDNCSFWGNNVITLAHDDANHFRTRYPGITNTSNVFPNSVICGD